MTTRNAQYLVGFAARIGADVADVRKLQRLGRYRAAASEHEMNGDPHFSSKHPADKNENARLWGEVVEAYSKQMNAIAAKWGMTLDYGVGLYPTLETGKDTIHFDYGV